MNSYQEGYQAGLKAGAEILAAKLQGDLGKRLFEYFQNLKAAETVKDILE